MRRAETPMTPLFQACAEVLHERLVPMHIRTLTTEGLTRLGIDIRTVEIQKEEGNVREKLLQAHQYGARYIPHPYSLGVLKAWFDDEQTMFNVMGQIFIPANFESGYRGAKEAFYRWEHMVHKCSPEQRLRGLMIEKHVAEYFKAQYPTFYLPPDNDGKYKQPCSHDFKLATPDGLFLVDVYGPNWQGKLQVPATKKTTQLHLACYPEDTGKGIIVASVQTGKEIEHGIIPEFGRSPERMIVWLNSLRDGLDYNAIKYYLSHTGWRNEQLQEVTT